MSSVFTQLNVAFSCFRLFVAFACFAIGLTVHAKPVVAQANNKTSVTTDWRKKRQELEVQFGADLVKIEDWCNKNGLSQQVHITHRLKHDRDLNRQYLFLPLAKPMPEPEQQTGELIAWHEKINRAKMAHGQRIFELAKEALQQDAIAVAYQLLYEVIYHDRDHAEGRRILGHKSIDNGWHIASKSFRYRPATKKHKFLPLAKGQYSLAETAHFKIKSTASKERTQELATQLELWHTVWRQVFFDYWGSKTSLADSFKGKKTMRIPGRKFDVVFFQNQQEYASKLAQWVPGVGVSSGYYSNKLKTSFFYDGDATTQQTWRHELTHQLFRESKGRSPDNVFEKNHVWLDEGVATYAESMVKLENYVTLGGFDAPRTQHARLQALLGNASLRVAKLNAMSQDAWQARSDPNLYAQSAAVVDTLMNENHGEFQSDFISLLKVIYHGPAKANSFSRKMKLEFDQVDKLFLNFLKVDANMVSKYLAKPETHTFLSFTGAQLSNNDYQKLGKCVNLQTLDLSGQTLTDEDLQPLSNCPALHHLILTSCQFEPNALLELGNLPGIAKIDLSHSQISPTQTSEINQLKQLKPRLSIVQ